MRCLTNALYPICPRHWNVCGFYPHWPMLKKTKIYRWWSFRQPLLSRKQPSFTDFAAAFHTIKEEAIHDPLALMKRWQSLGYTVESTVEIPGTMSRRGGIIDIFPPTSDMPARLEFFGNTVESIRLYDPANQRSVKRISSITIGPATELLAPFSENGSRSEDILKTIDFSNCSEETRQTFINELSELYRGQKTVSKEFYAPLFNQDSLLSYSTGKYAADYRRTAQRPENHR